MFPVGILHEQIVVAGIPISGVSIGVVDDRTTWLVRFLPEATDAQKKQAADIVAAFDPDLGRQRVDNLAVLQDTDLKMARVVEDLIDYFVIKRMLDPRELPQSAKDLLALRKSARGAMAPATAV
jgi:hypothetical protein